MIEVPTPVGPARLHVHPPAGRARGRLVLGHGAGGGFGAVDLTALTRAAVAGEWAVVLVEQPWLVAGRRVAATPPRLDQAWTAALGALDQVLGQVLDQACGNPERGLDGSPLVVGGRSAGARVACRTAQQVGAAAVICLAFPLHPPGRPERSRAGELNMAGVPVLVIQGATDAFGTAADVREAAGEVIEVIEVVGGHDLKRDPQAVARAGAAWLAALGMLAGPAALAPSRMPGCPAGEEEEEVSIGAGCRGPRCAAVPQR